MSAKRVLGRSLAAVLVPLLLLGLAEIAVRLFVDEKPRLAFQRVERNGEELFQRSPKGDYPWYPPYRKRKPPDTLRVACIGGSTAEGFPFPAQAFPRVLERMLGRAIAPRKVEVMGAGVGGLYSAGELDMLRELLDFELDAVVLYSCHNEFHPRNVESVLARARRPAVSATLDLVQRSALGRLLMRSLSGPPQTAPSVIEAAPDHRPIDGPEYQLVQDNFRETLEEFTRLCRDRDIPVVLCTAVSNLADFPPLANVFGAQTSADDRARVQELVAEAQRDTEAGRPDDALAALAAAAAIDDKPAVLAYERGRALRAAGRAGEALAAFQRARDTDGRLSRAITELNAIVRSFAGRPGVLVADIESMFAALSPQGITGDDYIVDIVHPNIDGQRLIAFQILKTMAHGGVLLDEAALAAVPEQTWKQLAIDPLKPDEVEARIGLANLTLALEKGRVEYTAVIARKHLEHAHQLAPERVDVIIELGILAGLDGHDDQSRALFTDALARDAAAFRPWAAACRNSPLVADLFRRGGVRFERDQAVAIR